MNIANKKGNWSANPITRFVDNMIIWVPNYISVIFAKGVTRLLDIKERVDYLCDLGIDPYPFDSRERRPKKVVKDKMDQFEEGKKLKFLTISKVEIDSWKQNKEYDQGLAIIPGRIKRGEYRSQYLTVIDCDSKEIKEKILRGLQSKNSGIFNKLEYYAKWIYIEYHKDDPDRFHIIFISPVKFPTKERTIDKNTKKSVELEVFCDNNHWITTSPSSHENGHQYEPMGTDKISVLPTKEGALLFLDMLKEIYKEYGIIYENNNANYNSNINLNSNNNNKKPPRKNPIDKELIDLLVNMLKPYCIKKGSRNNIYFAVSGYLRKSVVTYETAKEFVTKLCKETNDEEKEHRLRVLTNTYSENKKNDEIIGHKALEELINDKELKKLDEYIRPRYGGILEDKYYLKRRKKENKESAIIDWLILENHFLTFRDSEELLYYKDGIYVLDGEKLVNEIIEREYTDEYKTNEINEFINKIKRRTYVKRDEFDKDPDTYCFNNGLINLWNPTDIKPHDPNYYCLIKISHNYDPNTTATKFDKFLDEILKYKSHKDLLLESMGYSFYRGRPFDMCTILHGNGDNGKSVLTEIWGEVLGEDRVSYVPLKDLTNNRFALAQLVGKNLNIDPEMPKDTIVDSSMIKRLNSVHKVQVEEKFKPSYPARLFTKFVFNANKIPRTYDNSHGFYKRIRIITFPYNYVFKSQNELKENERIANHNLINELKEEIPGIINICFDALRKLLTDKPRIDVDAQRELYEMLSNPIGRFVDEEIEIWNNQMISYEPLGNAGSEKVAVEIGYRDCILPKVKGYEGFKKWCNQKGIPVAEDYNSFCRMIKDKFKDHEYFDNIQKTIDGKPRTWCWYGIRLKLEDSAAQQQSKQEVEEVKAPLLPAQQHDEEYNRMFSELSALPDEIGCDKCGSWYLPDQKEDHYKNHCIKPCRLCGEIVHIDFEVGHKMQCHPVK